MTKIIILFASSWQDCVLKSLVRSNSELYVLYCSDFGQDFVGSWCWPDKRCHALFLTSEAMKGEVGSWLCSLPRPLALVPPISWWDAATGKDFSILLVWQWLEKVVATVKSNSEKKIRFGFYYRISISFSILAYNYAIVVHVKYIDGTGYWSSVKQEKGLHLDVGKILCGGRILGLFLCFLWQTNL